MDPDDQRLEGEQVYFAKGAKGGADSIDRKPENLQTEGIITSGTTRRGPMIDPDDPSVFGGDHRYIVMSYGLIKTAAHAKPEVAIKMRGVFRTHDEADHFVKERLQAYDNTWTTMVGEIGQFYILPPRLNNLMRTNVHYQNAQLQEMMSATLKNDQRSKKALEARQERIKTEAANVAARKRLENRQQERSRLMREGVVSKEGRAYKERRKQFDEAVEQRTKALEGKSESP